MPAGLVPRIAARGAAAFFVGFALFQVALALGAPYGEMVWGGSDAVLPTSLRWASAAAAIYLAAAAGAMLVRAGDIGARLPQRLVWGFNVLLTVQMLLNTAANFAARTAAERYGMGAASALGALLCLIALAPRRRA